MNERFEAPLSFAPGWRAPSVIAPRTLGFAHLDDVLSAPELTGAERRAILASWVSDAHAVENEPGLRQLENGAVVRVDDVLQALRSLDEAQGSPDTGSFHAEARKRRVSTRPMM